MRVTCKEESESLKAFHKSFKESRSIEKVTSEKLLDQSEHIVLHLTTMGDQMKKGYKEELDQIRNYQDTEARELKRAITQSEVDFLDNSSVLLSGYSLQGKGQTGEVEGIVIGRFDGQEVVVLIESKHSLASKGTCVKAKKQLKATADHWDELKRLDGFLAEKDAIDAKKFGIHEHTERKIIVAYGAFGFPDQSAKLFEHSREHPTWLIRSNLNNKYVVHPIQSNNQD